METLSKLGRQLAMVVGRDENKTVKHFKQILSVVLARDNMHMLLSQAPEAWSLQNNTKLAKLSCIFFV